MSCSTAGVSGCEYVRVPVGVLSSTVGVLSDSEELREAPSKRVEVHYFDSLCIPSHRN